MGHICRISRIEEDHYVWLDRFSVRNLEILSSYNEQAPTLLDIIDQTISPMGSRLLKRWITMPLKEKLSIDERLDTVEFLLNNPTFSDELRHNIKIIGDLERLISKVAVNRIYPREIVHLKRALNAIEPIKTACMGEAKLLPSDSNKSLASIALQKIAEQLNPCHLICDRIGKEIKPEPSAMLSKGNVIAEGVDAELDELRKMAYSGKDYLLQMQQREIKNTGISSLKIAYNNVFGYYIEVTHTHKDKVPVEWTRKQTAIRKPQPVV